MIKLTKSPAPEILKNNAEKWTRIILEKLASSLDLAKSEKNRYNHADIKEALIKETAGKCAYCESKIRHIAYGDIEHITPKKPNPHLWFEWTNLTLACDICNTNKGESEGLLDPYEADPELAFHFIGTTVWAKPGNEIAKYTLTTIDLNRKELLEKRQERVERLMYLLEILSRTERAPLAAILAEDFKKELADDQEYAALSRSIAQDLRSKGLLA